MHSCQAGSPPGDLLFSCFWLSQCSLTLHGLPGQCVGWVWQKSLEIGAQGAGVWQFQASTRVGWVLA